jgi:dipeptidyl aminopeptidase/acylaminoacyl peptidase
MEEKVFIKNSQGLKLASILHFPDKNKKYPAVIVLHGFMGYKEEPHIEGLAKTLAQNGYVAIRFDCSGLGESEGTIEKDYSMSNYLKDIKSIYDYLRQLKFVNQDEIGISGHSMGGMLAIIYAAMYPKVSVCVAISSPTMMIVVNWGKLILEEWRRIGWYYKQTSRDGSLIKIPFSFIENANKFSALSFVHEMHCPFLSVLGSNDDSVNPDDTRKIFEMANEPKKLVEIEGMGHKYKNHPEQIKIVNENILNFLKKYL